MGETTPRVLVVEDEASFRDAVAEALAEAGIACEAVATGAAALETVGDPQVGAVVLDVTLPDLDGIEVLRRMRSERPSLQVIVVSGQADHALVLEALRLEASDYLAKPLHHEELVLAVRRALAAHAVESSWQRLRQRLRRLEFWVAELVERADADAGPEALRAFSASVAQAMAEVLDAGKTSVMLYDETSSELRVAAATGAGIEAGAMDPVALGEGVAGVALALGEALVVEDVYSDQRFVSHRLRERYESSSIAVVPLRTPERALGVLCATDRASGLPFGEDELALLQLLAVPVTHFLKRRSEAAALPLPAPLVHDDGELARAVCEALVLEIEPAAVLEGALRAASQRLDGATVAIHLIDNVSGTLVREHQVVGRGPGDHPRLPRNRGVTAGVLQGGPLVASEAPESEDAFDPSVDTALDGEGRPLVCAPLRLRGKVVGVLRAFPEHGQQLSERTAEILATTLSAAVRNVLLYRSLLESIDDLSEARREAAAPRSS